MRYAITGATGFVGGALARQLREAGHEVRALVRDPGKASAPTALGVELVPGDLDDTAALDRLCEGVDGLFHVAGWYKLGQRDPSVGDASTSSAPATCSRPRDEQGCRRSSTPARSR